MKYPDYFEQMKGRGTRTLGYDDLKKVTPSVHTNKTGFVIVDAVGVTRSVKTDSRPLERKKSVPLKDLLQGVLMGQTDEDTYTSLAGRLARLEKQITEDERKKFKQLSGGKTINKLAHDMLDAYNPDKLIETATEKFNLRPDSEPGEDQKQDAQKELINRARDTFTGELNEFIENVRKSHEQIIDDINLDELKYAGWDKQAKVKAEDTIEDFKTFMEANKDEITALSIFYNQPYNRRNITYEMIKEVLDTLKRKKPRLAPVKVWQAYEQVEKVNGKYPWTKGGWFYDFRTNIHFTKKKNQMTYDDLKDFIACYKPENRHKRKETWSEDNPDGRWRKFTYEDIMARDKTSLDIFWIRDESLADLDNLPDPDVLAEEIIENLEAGVESFKQIMESINGQ